MTRPTRRLLLAPLAVLALLVAACGSDGGSSSDGGTPAAAPGADAAGPELSGEITVSAAASLTDSFTEIGEGFRAAHPDADVTFTFDSSGTLSQQLLDGAPVDVFASADEANMAKLTDADLVEGEPTVFARNQLVIVTEPGNPEGIGSLDDLVDAGVIALCGEDVPCGRFAEQVLGGAGVVIPEGRVTRGQNVKATLTAVTEGDAVAGIVYVTDAIAAGDRVATVDIPEDENAVATYPVAALKAAGDTEVAAAFVDYVTSDEAQAVLEEAGFLPPR